MNLFAFLLLLLLQYLSIIPRAQVVYGLIAYNAMENIVVHWEGNVVHGKISNIIDKTLWCIAKRCTLLFCIAYMGHPSE